MARGHVGTQGMQGTWARKARWHVGHVGHAIWQTQRFLTITAAY